MRYQINSGDTTRFHVTGRRNGEKPGSIRIYLYNCLVEEVYYKFSGFETYWFSWKSEEEYEVEIDNLEISLAYRFCPEDVLEQGVEFIEFGDRVCIYGKKNLSMALKQNYRNWCHFTPYKNWMNDPNGFCWFKGYYHLFYQYNPNSQEWGNMHWGHAVSKDLIHWLHQPIAVYPQIELNGCDGYRGGAFSGSAAIEDGVMHLFYTRHFGKTDRTWQRQWQVTKKSEDGITFDHEECAIWETPEGVDWHFRDPKLIKLNGKWNMILAGSCYDRPAVFRYESEDLKIWNYCGILYQEQNPEYGIAECPDFFVLDGKYILIISYIYADGRKDGRNVVWYIGNYKDGKFHPEHKGLLDEGKDFYAPQSFAHNGERICVGWNCHRMGQHIKEVNGSNGSISLPRKLNVRNGKVYSQVIPEIQSLFTESKDSGPYYLHMKKRKYLQGKTEVVLAESKTEELKLYIEEKLVVVVMEKKDIQLESRALPFECSIETENFIEELDIYVDRAIMELFINRGEQACTRRFYLPGARIKANTGTEDAWSFEIKGMDSIW